jgi:hypothetical protein
MRRLVGATWVAAVAVWALGASAAGVPVDQASKEQWRAAQKTFLVADDLYDAKRFSEALTAYRASYDIVASPNSRLMIARSLRELGQLEPAYYELLGTISDAEAFAKKDEKYRASARAAREDLEALKNRVALLTLRLSDAPPGTKVSVGARQVDPGALGRALVVEPGPVRVIASAPGGPEVRHDLTLEAGSASELELELGAVAIDRPSATPSAPVESSPADDSSRVSSEPSSLLPWAYVAGGVGVAGLAAFGIFGAMTNSKFGALETECADGHCPPDRSDDIDTGRRYQLIANIGLVAGVVGLGTGAALFVLSSGQEKQASSRKPWVAVGPGNVQVGGRF